MTKREIIGSGLGLIIVIGVTVLVMSFMLPPSHPNFGPMVGTIVTVFVCHRGSPQSLGSQKTANGRQPLTQARVLQVRI